MTRLAEDPIEVASHEFHMILLCFKLLKCSNPSSQVKHWLSSKIRISLDGELDREKPTTLLLLETTLYVLGTGQEVLN